MAIDNVHNQKHQGDRGHEEVARKGAAVQSMDEVNRLRSQSSPTGGGSGDGKAPAPHSGQRDTASKYLPAGFSLTDNSQNQYQAANARNEYGLSHPSSGTPGSDVVGNGTSAPPGFPLKTSDAAVKPPQPGDNQKNPSAPTEAPNASSATDIGREYDKRQPYFWGKDANHQSPTGSGGADNVQSPASKPTAPLKEVQPSTSTFKPTDSHTFDLTRAWNIPKFE